MIFPVYPCHSFNKRNVLDHLVIKDFRRMKWANVSGGEAITFNVHLLFFSMGNISVFTIDGDDTRDEAYAENYIWSEESWRRV